MVPLIAQKIQNEIIAHLRAGGLIALPTETVYGLAGDARNEEAIQKIFKLKNRPCDHPLIVHLASANELTDWARDIPDYAHQLAQAFWPGPMTFILKKQGHVLDSITAQQDTIGLRVPSHRIAQSILHGFGGALAAPSANRFGHISPTLAKHVRDEFQSADVYIVDGGICGIGIESTIIDCTQERPRLLRPGIITPEAITAATSLPIETSQDLRPKSSGSLANHYSPKVTTYLRDPETLDTWLKEGLSAGMPLMVVLSRRFPQSSHKSIHWVVMPHTADDYAHGLYEHLRRAENITDTAIIIEDIPQQGLWLSIRDRLQRASAQSKEQSLPLR